MNDNDLLQYQAYLKAFCSLSRLFTNTNNPYLEYRAMENIFCKTFNAQNLAREDSAFDAKLNNIGYGLKTFVAKNEGQFEKVAEFNKLSDEIKSQSCTDLKVQKIAEFRNNRINLALNLHGLNSAIYHCVARKDNNLIIFETDYSIIDLQSIKIDSSNNTSIKFSDKKNKYNFNHSKSVLYKQFYCKNDSILATIPINVFQDPFEVILNLEQIFSPTKENSFSNEDFVILPLYSTKKKNKEVPEKSGLNHWNAGGRERKAGELYIPVPIDIHKKKPNFFPNKDEYFELKTPSYEIFQAKLCQENRKALMTNPNNCLEKWLLRKLLQLKEGELLTYSKLISIGFDAVKITKIEHLKYQITTATLDSYEEFIATP
jgi:hypothetical protein